MSGKAKTGTETLGIISPDGTKLIVDMELYGKITEFAKKKEEEYWEYVLSGQRDRDMFGPDNEEIIKRLNDDQEIE